ncbi:MAG: hypothetical protein H7Y17_02265 [Chlorobia bacterium]|nr:hypothetical protein [Fimbriimonadaceae bacterium]
MPTSFPATLPTPDDEISGSLWIHVGAERIRNKSGLSSDQVQGLIKIADTRAAKDPSNAFWKLSLAIFYSHIGKVDLALGAWMDASRCLTYNDYQSRYLSQVRDVLARSSATNAWQFAYCYRLRSFAFVLLVDSYARNLVSELNRSDPKHLSTRYATLANGGLIRDGSRNLATMQIGISIVELASHPRQVQSNTSIKRLLIAHFEFKEALRTAGMIEQAENVESVYNENDGWSALTARQDTQKIASNLTLASAVWPNLPGVFLQGSMISSLLWLLGYCIIRFVKHSPSKAAISTYLLAVTMVVAVYMLTQSWLAMSATALCCLFSLISPKTVRASVPADLGPLFTVVNITLAIAFTGLVATMFATRTLPVLASASAFDPQIATLVDFNVTAGLAIIVVACLFLVSPLWALAQHVRTLDVLGRGFQKFGVIGTTIGLLLCVVSTPICIYFESENQQTFRMLLENEPVYYLRQ